MNIKQVNSSNLMEEKMIKNEKNDKNFYSRFEKHSP